MKYFTQILLLFFIITLNCNAQNNPDIKRTWHWYFGGKAGLDFSSGSPVAVTNGQMYVRGNPVSMSDTAGNLLFYSNRYTVWNKNHQVMPNANGLIGNYGTDSYANAICAPQPGNHNIYYLFFWQCDSTWLNADFVYTIIDMNLNGGLGDVISKQNFTGMKNPCNGMTAVKHANNTDIWIIAKKFDTDSLYAFLLTNSGLNPTPVTSSIGITNYVWNLKGSPDGSKLSGTLLQNGPVILDFDKSTGIASNPIIFPAIIGNGGETYGIEFSPDSKKLYFAGDFEITPGLTWGNTIYQVDLTGTPSQIVNSKLLLDSIVISDSTGTNPNPYSNFTEELQLAVNNKIYIAKNSRPKLAAINYPDIIGTGCNYIDSAIYLMGRVCIAGLPSFVNDYFLDFTTSVTNIPGIDDNIICYPNPFIYATNLIIPTAENIYSIQFIDLLGKDNMIEKKISRANNQTMITIERNNLPAGIYLLRIQTTHYIYYQKLIITN